MTKQEFDYEALPEMVDLKTAVERLNRSGIKIGYQALRKLAFEGKLPVVRLTHSYLLNWSAVVDLFRAGGDLR
ncbi:MAG: hypothetical protein K6D92_04465 [Erysipelotrichaceae bacterium]|nr:hypothetical protein [Erysipelotrichaceae bacterium]